MAGYISTAERWAQFSLKWKLLLSQVLSDDGDLISFKMARFSKIRNLKKSIPQFHRIINDHVICSISSVFSLKEYNDVCIRVRRAVNASVPIHFLPGHHAFAIGSLLYAFHRARADSPELFPFDEIVDFYFDEHSSKSWIIDGWDAWIAQLSESEKALYGQSPRFEDDNVFLPIQAADFRAWSLRDLILRCGRGSILEASLPFDTRDALPIHHFHFDFSSEFISSQLMAGAARQWPDEDIILLDKQYLSNEPFIQEEFPFQKLIASINRNISRFRWKPR